MSILLQAAEVKHKAREVGFTACGLAQAVPVSAERAAEYLRWIGGNYNGEMDYLARNVEKRLDPRKLVDGARTVVSVAVNYNPGRVGEAWRLARYAYGTDYHEVVRGMLRELMQRLGLQEHTDGRPFVDTAPVDEKYWAQQAGLGWRGRNSQLIIPRHGSYFFLGELILTCDADHYDSPMSNHCGACHRCLDACPAQALKGDGTMDARRCLSYLTIERRGELPETAQEQMGTCFYGCDRCAEVCPWNVRFASPTDIKDFQPREALLQMQPADWQQLTPEKYRKLFSHSAVKRAKFEGLKRNITAVGRNQQFRQADGQHVPSTPFIYSRK